MKPFEIDYTFWGLQSLAMLLTAWFLPKLRIPNPLGAVLMVVALAFVNVHVWDAALFFEIPNSLTARTLTLLVANGVIFWVLVKILPWIEIDGILIAFVAPVMFSVLNLGISYMAHHVDWVKTYQEAWEFIQSVKGSIDTSKTPGAKISFLMMFSLLG